MRNCYSTLFPSNDIRIRYSNDTFMKILPAMCDRRACIWCIHRNNSSKELEEWSWMFWYAMIGPSCILKLFYLSSVCVSHLFLLKRYKIIPNYGWNMSTFAERCIHRDIWVLLLLIMQLIRLKIHIYTKHLNCTTIWYLWIHKDYIDIQID